ncbi:hypothetical protein TL18_00850 [Methanobrevibacter sp. YE315]|uniref:hypothetical protein n=1 Tax=Methanobrevibacter sp. YE315 TaxID=1609968 RepID=UPI000764D2B7|nr:hypothetical protein [Methanobrevibacter sp. YE315]AMD16712.1 hypothetical protein TL18_00850 [Methanobrevibacter sp. YE315]
MNVDKDLSIVYDPEILTKIKEMIEEGFEKLKTFVKKEHDKIINKKPNFKLYNELDQKFDDISFKLKELKLYSELNYFISISDYILYIIQANSIDSTFGYCNFALELLEFFMEIFKTNIKYYNSPQNVNSDEYTIIQDNFKEKYHEYRREFYWNIYEYSDDFDEKQMYEFAKSLRD